MVKKCVICGSDASFLIKGLNEPYCKTCAKEFFSDLTLLQTVEEKFAKLKQAIGEKTQQEEEQ